MFQNRINELFQTVGVSSAEIARAAGCDPSNISRMRSGARIPPKDGRAAKRLSEAVIRCAAERGRIGSLRALTGCSRDTEPEELNGKLMDWLYADSGAKPAKSSGQTDSVRFRSFGGKFSALMELAGLSNVRAGRLLNLDASYISRFRNGLRRPDRNSKIADSICEVMLVRIREQNGLDALAQRMKTDLPSDGEEAAERLRAWLFDLDRADESPLIEELVDNIDSFSIDPDTVLPPDPPSLPDQAEGETVEFGKEGLRSAVLRFLGAVLQKGGEEMRLYSDEPMDWLVDDPAFRRQWAALMLACVKRGVRIRIIHNVDRNLTEMVAAIKSWMPLYMSGLVESFYCRKQRDSRFTHTIFLCPGVACVEAANVAGKELSNIYRFHTDPALLARYAEAYAGLAEEAKPLVRIAVGSEDGAASASGGLTQLGTVLSLETMPEETLLSLLDRCGVGADDPRRAEVRSAWSRRRALFETALSAGGVWECVPLAPLAKDGSFAAPVLADLPGMELAYSPEEYTAHVRSVLDLLESRRNYRFVPLPEPPFARTRIVLTDSSASVTRLKPPCVTFVITHPAICSTFAAYADRLKSTDSGGASARERLKEFCK
ncbi:MAG: hypothetical protein E7576_14065 [Ruminococcaceae bacterium]|jgi:hypothetical protein|nr:hypothetical protein [Oscillospiraceae bacterium]